MVFVPQTPTGDVCLFVKLDCHYVVQQKVEVSTRDRICRWIGYLHAEADLDSGNSLRNCASFVLNQYRTLMGNRIRWIEWYDLLASMTTGRAQSHIWNSIEFGRFLMQWCWCCCGYHLWVIYKRCLHRGRKRGQVQIYVRAHVAQSPGQQMPPTKPFIFYFWLMIDVYKNETRT